MKAKLPGIHSIKRVHIIGVCGTLMGAFAAYLKRQNLVVTGSDQNVYPPMSDVLTQAGVVLCNGYKAENLAASGEKPDLVVIGNVISSNNPEARAAIDNGFAYSSLPEAMENLFLTDTRNLVVAGTHGKTTTSSMLANVLLKSGKDPGYFIGGVSHDLPFSFNIPKLEKGSLFVLEGDEYDTAFWDKVPKFNHYLPNDVILTSVEYDHADIYPDLASVIRAFEGLIARVRPGGKMIACFDYQNVRDLVSKAKFPVLSYSSDLNSGARFGPRNVRTEGEYTRFEILDNGKTVNEISFQLSGMHNVMNALAVWIECRELNISDENINSAFRSFRGVKRRQEVRGEKRGVTVIDDFAHHPTAVKETLRGLRSKYSQCRLMTVFEPRSATSRRKVFQKDYAAAFQEADVIFISQPFDQTKISSEDQFSSAMLVEDLIRAGKEAYLITDIDQGVQEVARQSRQGDLVAVLSNGGFGGFIAKLLQTL